MEVYSAVEICHCQCDVIAILDHMALDYSRIPAHMLNEKDVPFEWFGVLLEGVELQGRTFSYDTDDLFGQPVYVSGRMLDPETYVLSSIDWAVENRTMFELASVVAAMHGVQSDVDEASEPDSNVFWNAYPECMSEDALVSLLDYLKQKAL